jgi:hypothetical protein
MPFTALLCADLALAATGLLPPDCRAADIEAGPPQARSVTVYRAPWRDGRLNLEHLQGFALVTETRAVALPAGEHRLRFPGVADGIEPASAILTGLPSSVLEKNRDAQVLSPGALAAAALGQEVILVRTHRRTGRTTRTSGTLRADSGGVVFESSEGIEALRCSGLPETFTFSGTADLSPTPTLSVKVRSLTPVAATVTLSYLARGFDWQATYTATLSSDAATLDLGAWVTLANSNSVSFPDADAAVVAGRLNRDGGEVEPVSSGERIVAQCWPAGTTSDISTALDEDALKERALLELEEKLQIAEKVGRLGEMHGIASINRAAPPPHVEEEQLGDLKLYRVPEATSVNARQMKQVRLLDREAIPVQLLYVREFTAGREFQLAASRVLRTRNDRAHHLGLPLPSGSVSIFIREKETPLLLAEGPLRDIAVGEDFEIGAGEAPDVQVRASNNRTQATARLDQIPRLPGSVPIQTGMQTQLSRIEITNARRTAVLFEARLGLPDGWQLVRSTVTPVLRNGRQVMRIELPAGSRVTIRYQSAHRILRGVRRR